MTEAQMKEAVKATVLAGWTASRPDVPLALDAEAIPTADTFALLTITPTTGSQLTSGERGTRLVGRNGWIAVKLWTPPNAGTAAADALVELVRSLVEMQNIAGPDGGETIDTQVTSTQPVGDDGRWYMLLARTPFTYYETK